MIRQSLAILKDLQHPTGLFSASSKNVLTGYDLCWIRDSVYAALGFEAVEDHATVRKAYQGLLDIFIKHEEKIDWMIKEPDKQAWRYIHARYHPITLKEREEHWGNKQNDAVGAVLFKIGDLEKKGVRVIRSNNDVSILQKLVHYLEAIQYWMDEDNGMWEENEEVHASSVGACVAGLSMIKGVHGIQVPSWLIRQGQEALNELLPRESATKDVDLALLSLIYPYNIVTQQQRDDILKNVETKLVREKGVLRYERDTYYSNGKEAEWCFGFPWLAIIYKQLNSAKYLHFMKKTMDAMNEKGELPELYYGGTNEYNPNTPLGWGQSLAVVAAV